MYTIPKLSTSTIKLSFPSGDYDDTDLSQHIMAVMLPTINNNKYNIWELNFIF